MLIRNVIPPPPIWFRLPPGYHTLDLARLNELEHVAEALLTPILASSSAVTDSLRDASALVMLLQAIHEGGGIHTSIGVHPDGQDGAAVSLFSLSVRGIESRTPGLAVAQSGLAIANSPIGAATLASCWNCPSVCPRHW